MERVSSKLSLGVFLMGTGHHIASWRSDHIPEQATEDVEYFINIARLAERGKLDLLFLSDGLSFHKNSHPAEVARFEPITLLSALSVVTKHIGLAATATTTYNEPFHLARKFASLDHLSKGRAAWNVVTSYYQKEAHNFNQSSHLAHEERYIRADECIEVVKGLWDSWEDDAKLENKKTGQYYDPQKVHELNHQGQYYAVKGPLNSSRTPQGRPVIIQAGSSESGIDLAARTAEVVFTAQTSISEGQAFYKKVKQRAVSYGRTEDEIKIMPGIAVYTGKTDEEAKGKFQQLQSLITPEVGLQILSEYLGDFDLSPYPLDGPLPMNIPETNGNKSRRELLINLSIEKELTIKDLYLYVAGARGHLTVVGSGETVADVIEEWFVSGAADGFNLMLPEYPHSLEDFITYVIPILQSRGLFRREYEGATLREHLHIQKPVNRYSREKERV